MGAVGAVAASCSHALRAVSVWSSPVVLLHEGFSRWLRVEKKKKRARFVWLVVFILFYLFVFFCACSFTHHESRSNVMYVAV